MFLEELIDSVEPKIAEIEAEMALPEVAIDQARMTKLAREYRRLNELLKTRDKLAKVRQDVLEHQDLLDDPDLGELAAEELPHLQTELSRMENRLKALLIPENPEDVRNAVLEIRAGTGGDEAGLFAADLYEMYDHYCEKRKWKRQVLSANYSALGGIKEITLSVTGEGVYGRLKLESGVHRVQRVPATETSGRLHTSAATVAVLPEAEEIDIQIYPDELRIDTFRSSGPGGQHVNKTDSAIRITHLPTGMVVSCQDEKSQLKNKNQAMKVLRARLFQQALDEEQNRRASQRRSQVSSGDRSAKIRTYNFPQDRVTDHRIPISIYRLYEVLAGNLDLLLDPLADFFVQKQVEELSK